MATAGASRPANPSRRKYAEVDEYVDFQLSKTRSTIKSTDILTTVTGVLCVVFGYLLMFVVFEHWVIEEGFSRLFRSTMLVLITLLCGSWITWRAIIPSIRKVNSLFAAKVLEESSPELKSNLLNLVDLKEAGREISPTILNSVQKHAAVSLSKVDIDTAVDRRPLMRMAYVLLAIVVVSCIYTVLTPKKISASVMRAILPTSSETVSTSTTIIEVEPGATEVLARTHLKVSVTLQDVIPDDVTLVYTTSDRGYVDERVEMREAESAGLHVFECTLSGENGRGLLRDFVYHIEAGDAVSDEFAVKVIQPPTVEVKEIYYEFPSYTKIENTTVPSGNIDALQGTLLTIRAKSNMPLKAAKIKTFESDDRVRVITERSVPRDQINGAEITIKWRAEILEDGTYPHFYHIECRSERGHTNPEPTLYKIAIRPDLPPVITQLDPLGDITRPSNATVPLMVQARDPDFMLERVKLIITKGEEEIDTQEVFRGEKTSFVGRFELPLKPFNLKKDDVLTYWFEASDNREPRSNRRATPQLNIQIGDAVSKEEAEEQLENEKEEQDKKVEEAIKNADEEATDQPDDADTTANPSENREPENTEQPQEQPNDTDSSTDETTEGKGNEAQNADTESGKPGQKSDDPNGDKQNSDGNNENQEQNEFSPNGEDDAEVLQKLLDRQREKQNNSKPSNQQNNPDNKTEQPNNENKQDSDGNKPETEKSDTPQDETKTEEPGEKQSSDPNKSEPNDSKENSASNNDDTNQSDSQNNDPNQPNSDPKNESDPNGNPEKSDSKGTASDNKDSNNDDKTDKPDSNATEDNKPQETPANDSKSATPEKPKQEGKKGEDEPGNEGGQKGDTTEGGKQESKDTQDGEGSSKDQQKPNKSKDGKQSDKPLEGEKKQTEDDPNAKKGEATGDEKGEGTPEDAPENKAKNSDNVKRKDGADPKTKPSKDPTEKNPNQDKADGKSSANPENAKPKPENKKANNEENPDQTTPNKDGKKPSKDSSDEQDQQDKGNDPLKGNPKEQKSKQSEGGDGGKSKANDQGNKGSKKEGAGDKTDKPGEAQKSSEKPSDKKGEGKGSPKDGKGDGNKGNSGGKEGKGKGGSPSSTCGKEGAGAEGAKPSKDTDDNKVAGKGDGNKKADGKQRRGGGTDQGNKADGQEGESEGGGDVPGNENAPNLKNTKKATDLALKDLQDQLKRGDVDKELLDELGWTEDQLKKFSERMQRQMNQPDANKTEEAQARRRQFEETLKSLKLNSTSARRNDSVTNKREINGVGPRRVPVSSEYKNAYKNFTQELSKRKKAKK